MTQNGQDDAAALKVAAASTVYRQALDTYIETDEEAHKILVELGHGAGTVFRALYTDGDRPTRIVYF